uniref:Glutamate decarboxylase 1 n=1 Tax=Neolamprologus brichardi TaxID=32507 RepID=A0A3Q4GRP2_NEOBR
LADSSPPYLLPAKNGEEPTMQFLLEVVDILTNYVKKTFDRSTKVLDFHHPHQLLEGIEGFNLELSDQPESLEQILVDCRDTLKYGVRTGHPRFFNQLSSGLDIIGLAGEWLTSTANTNMFTYEIAPVFVLMEQLTLKKMREMIGWPNGEGDGLFSPGGAISNMYSVMIARYKYFPEVKTKGMSAAPRLVLFTSEHVSDHTHTHTHTLYISGNLTISTLTSVWICLTSLILFFLYRCPVLITRVNSLLYLTECCCM